MNKKMKVVVGCVLSVLLNNTFAATNMLSPQTPAPMKKNVQDFWQIYQLAAKNNATYHAAGATFSANQEEVPKALAALFPTLDLGYNIARSDTHVSPVTLLNSDDISTGQNFTAQATQVLFNWADWEGFSQSQYQVKADAVDLATAQQQLIMSTSTDYFGVLFSLDQLDYAKANEAWHKATLEQAEQQYKVGTTSIADYQASKAEYETSVADLIAAQNSVSTSYATLAQLIGQSIPNLKLKMLKSNFPFVNPKPSKLSYWLNLGLKQNLNIVKNQYIVSAAGEGVSGAYSAFLPNASLDGKYEKDWGNDSADTKQATIGANASINVFNGGQDLATLHQQKYTRDAAQFNLQQAIRATHSSVQTDYLTVISDVSLVEADKQAVISAQVSVDAYEAGYKVGTQTMSDLLQQQNQLFAAQQTYARQKYTYINDLLTLKKDVGTLSVKDVQSINQWLI